MDKDKDFIHWDDSDINLEELLGDYTEYENEKISGGECSDDDDIEETGHTSDIRSSTSQARSPKTSQGKENSEKTIFQKKYKYSCPVCKNKYVTIQGFRGHVNNKHQRSDLKAHENKLTDSEVDRSAQSQASSSEPKLSTTGGQRLFSSVHDLREVLTEAIHATLKEMSPDKPISERRKEINGLCPTLQENHDIIAKLEVILYEPLFSLFVGIGKGTSLSSDRESMWKIFHKLRLDDTLLSQILALLETFTEELTCTLFIQSFLQKLIPAVTHIATLRKEKKTEICDVTLSENDQSVLFYVAGFIIHALRKKKCYHGDLHELTLRRLMTHAGNGDTFLTKFKKWTSKCNRGGLQVPNDNLFLLLKHMELHLRKCVDLDNLKSHSLLTDSLKEGLLTTYMVSYYWDKLMAGEQEALKCKLLEDIVTLFLKIRGNAVTKLAKKHLQKAKSEILKQRNSNSLRKKLKCRDQHK